MHCWISRTTATLDTVLYSWKCTKNKETPDACYADFCFLSTNLPMRLAIGEINDSDADFTVSTGPTVGNWFFIYFWLVRLLANLFSTSKPSQVSTFILNQHFLHLKKLWIFLDFRIRDSRTLYVVVSFT